MVSQGSRASLTTKVLAAVTALAAACVLVVDEAGVADVDGRVLAAAGILAALLAFVATSQSAVREYRGRGATDRREQLGFALRQLAFTVAELTSLDVRELGLAVYVVRRERPFWWRKRLDRAARERSVNRPSTSRVVWRPGKGVIGRCVAAGTDVAQDVQADTSPWRDADQDDWDLRIPDDVKAGFSFDEFRFMLGRYHVVVATPVLDDSGVRTRIVGCLALDGPSGTFDLLAADDVRAAMGRVAPTIGALLR